jgi:nicotinate phosphoribosyltransferase
MIFDEEQPASGPSIIVDPLDATRRKLFSPEATRENLLVPVLREGAVVGELPPLAAIRQRVEQQLNAFQGGMKRFANPHEYPVGLEAGLHERKTKLILRARGFDA